jgi:CubicO group peptidase (beta-lactamase class C family)
MTAPVPCEARRPSRRTMLGLLGGSALAAGGAVLAAPRAARASASMATVGPGVPVPPALRPGGEFDQFVRQQAALDQFSGNLLLAYRGRPVLARTYGMAVKEMSVSNTQDTLFALASVTKTMTATAVMQLAQQGKLSLWETLATYLKGFPAQIANFVTVHQLLTMTSGLSNYYVGTDWFAEQETWTTADQVLNGTMEFIHEQGLLFGPGTQYFYSDSGFVVLGAIVQQVSGQPYWNYMRQNIFAPAGMTRTAFYTKPELLALDSLHQVAHPYATQKTGGRADVFGNIGFIGLPDGANGPYTTVTDMLSFATSLQSGTLLGPAFVQLLYSGKVPVKDGVNGGFNGSLPPGITAPPWQAWFSAYGFEDAVYNNQHVAGHGGEGPGITTNLDIYPGLDWAAVILENYDLTPFGTTPDVAPIVHLERQLITEQAHSWAASSAKLGDLQLRHPGRPV